MILLFLSFLIIIHLEKSINARSVAAITAFTGTCLGFVIIVGYLYEAPLLYGGNIIPVALTTATALFFSGLSLVTMAGNDVLPNKLFIGSSVQSLLLRSFLPLILIITIFDEFLDKILSITFHNPALSSSLLLIAFIIIISMVISRLSQKIGCEIERLNNQRIKAEEALSEDRERLQQITSSLREVVWLRDASTREILYVNPAYEKIFNNSCSSFYKNPDSFIDSVLPEDMHIVINAMKRYNEGNPIFAEYRIKQNNGNIRWISDRTVTIKDKRGEVYRVAVIAEDITERKESEEKLRLQKQELQNQNEELDAFSRTVAHDLKNPISLIIGYAEELMDEDNVMTDDVRRQCIQALNSSAKKSISIIDELLVLAGMRQSELIMQPVNINDIISEVQRRLSKMIFEMNAGITIQLSMPLAMGYAPWVEEVIMNYFSNALKYGGRPPLIEIGYDQLSASKIRFWIQDNGKGLPEQEKSKLFTPFTRLNQIKIEGHGLGLSIVQRIMEKLGGEVGAESEIGKGSKFYFTLSVAT